MLITSLFLLTAWVPFAIADVEFTSPAAGNSIPGGGKTLSVTWKESGDDPPISTFTTYTLFQTARYELKPWTESRADGKTGWRLTGIVKL